MKRVVITGIAGFEGSNMALAFLREGYEVVGVDIDRESVRLAELPKDVEVQYFDIREAEPVRAVVRGADAVIHLAGQVSHVYGQQNPSLDLEINANGVLNILEAMKDENPKCHLLFASSRSVYGFPHHLPIDEEHSTVPIDAYGISKLACEHYIRLYAYHHGLLTTVFRQANLFGPRQQVWTSDFQMVSWIFRCVKLEEEFTFYGDGKQTRDFLYIDDCVRAYLMAVQNPWRATGRVFNLGGKDYITWNELIELCSDVTGKYPRVKYVDYPPLRLKLENPHSWLSYFKAKQVLGWTPMVGVREGLIKMDEYFTEETLKRYTEKKP